MVIWFFRVSPEVANCITHSKATCIARAGNQATVADLKKYSLNISATDPEETLNVKFGSMNEFLFQMLGA